MHRKSLPALCQEITQRIKRMFWSFRSALGRRQQRGAPGAPRCDRGETGLAAPRADGFLRFRVTGSWHLGDLGFGSTDVQPLAQLGVHLGEDILVFLEERARILTALADALSTVAIPGAGFFHDVVGYSQIEYVTLPADAFAVK